MFLSSKEQPDFMLFPSSVTGFLIISESSKWAPYLYPICTTEVQLDV